LKCEDCDEEDWKIDGSGASVGDFAGGFYEAAGLVGEQAGAGAARGRDADWGDCGGPIGRQSAKNVSRLWRWVLRVGETEEGTIYRAPTLVQSGEEDFGFGFDYEEGVGGGVAGVAELLEG
jgi:hypothetical protein